MAAIISQKMMKIMYYLEIIAAIGLNAKTYVTKFDLGVK